MTVMGHLPGFGICQMKYGENTAHSMVALRKENDSSDIS
jgi:hypothetical protein